MLLPSWEMERPLGQYCKGGNYQRPPGGTQRQRSYNQKSGIIYRFKYDRVECDEEYIWESSRTFRQRFKEHLKLPSAIYDHFSTTGHTTTLENFSRVGREGPKPHEAYKRSNIYKGQQSIPKQKHRQILSASHMGWGSVQHLRTQNRIK